MDKTTRIGILGADGRMGLTLASVILGNPTTNLTSALTAPDSPHLGKTVKGHDLVYTDDIAAGLSACDVLIDFSAPKAILRAARQMTGTRCKAIVSGTTGLSGAQETELAELSKGFALLRSGNFSLGVNLLEVLVEQAAKALGEDWDIEISEMHHRHKVDAPSGTALMLGEAAAKGRGVNLSDKQVTDRNGLRKEGDIGFVSLRGGDVVGTHDVKLSSPKEMITLSHNAFDRSVFAEGAVKAARWLVNQKSGLYSMKDFLGL